MMERRLMFWLLLSLVTAPLSFGTKPPPYHFQKALLDRIGAEATPASPNRDIAVEILKQVALGRQPTMAPDFATTVRSTPEELRERFYLAPEVREHAFRVLGKTGLPEASEFLAGVQASDVGDDPSQSVWRAVLVASWEVKFKTITELGDKIAFLEKALADRNGGVKFWAVTELCNSGALESSAAIRRAVTRMDRRNAEREMSFCEARMRVVRSNPDRAIALGSALSVHTADPDSRLTWWAVYELSEMGTPAAVQELARFTAEIDQTPAAARKFEVLRQSMQSLQQLREASLK
jgi:hypothetical protein